MIMVTFYLLHLNHTYAISASLFICMDNTQRIRQILLCEFAVYVVYSKTIWSLDSERYK